MTQVCYLSFLNANDFEWKLLNVISKELLEYTGVKFSTDSLRIKNLENCEKSIWNTGYGKKLCNCYLLFYLLITYTYVFSLFYNFEKFILSLKCLLWSKCWIALFVVLGVFFFQSKNIYNMMISCNFY